MKERTYSAKVYGVVVILERVDFNFDNICCPKLKNALEGNVIYINLANNKFTICDIILEHCPFCFAKLEVIQTDKYIDKDDKNIIWKKVAKNE